MKLRGEARLKKALKAKRVDAGVRQEAVDFGRAVVATGATLTAAAQRLGMKPNTLHRWHQLAGEAGPRFLEVAGPVQVEGLEVVWPSGHTIRVGGGNVQAVFMALEATCCRQG
jgi:transposase-like protein